MPIKSTPTQWSSVLKALHWLIALMIVALATVGWYMKGLPPSPSKIQVYALHKSTGITLLALVIARIGVRLWAGRPEDLPMPRWQRVAADLVHAMLYVVLVAMPLSGWVFNSAANFPLRWFGLFTVPAIAGPDPAVKAWAATAHLFLFWILLALFLAHVGGALQHHFIDKDATLIRMWLSRKGDTPP